jgi:WS/DGAT/MGAT family acyltransferase
MHDRLNPVEALMWRAGQDPALRMTIGNLMLLERAPDRDLLAARLAEAAADVPRLRRRPDDPTGARTRPVWIEDAELDGHAHLSVMSVPAPGGQRQLLELVALLEPRPFDAERPPWDVTLIDGLEGGRAALYIRAHHAVADGPGGLDLVAAVLDPTDDSAEADSPGIEAEPEGEQDTGSEESSTDDGDVVATSRRRPGTLTVTIDLTRAAGQAREAAGTARDVAAAVREVDPLQSVVRALQRGLDVANSVSQQAVVIGGPLSALPPARSIINAFELISIPGAKAGALALGGSRNDLVVAATAAGLGAYHEKLGLPTPELRLAMPAARHRNGGPGGNWFAPTRLVVPTSSDPPGPFFGVITERLANARREPSVPLASPMAAMVSLLPARALLPVVRAQARSVDFVATCFAGLRGDRTLCGVAVHESYPFGPRLGCLMNVTAFGNGDRLDVGLTLDPVAITEPDTLLDCMSAAFVSLVGPHERPPTSRARATRS